MCSKFKSQPFSTGITINLADIVSFAVLIAGIQPVIQPKFPQGTKK